MQRLIVSSIVLAMTMGGRGVEAAGDTKADQILAQARAAIGGDQHLGSVQGLSAAGTFQREMGDRQMNGEITIDLQLPDKILRTEGTRFMGDTTVEMMQGLNGDQVLRGSRTIGGGPNMVMRFGNGPEAEGQALRNQRADLARFTLAFLLSSSAMPLEYTYGGEAEADDGKADVLDAKGPGGFAARLFFDKKTHRPLMLSYRGAAPRMITQTRRGDGPPAAGAPPAQLPPPEIVEIQWFFDDYKTVDGVLLPHHLSRSIDGKPAEDVTFKTIKINPTFKADTFSAK
jgi:hypothetical protein